MRLINNLVFVFVFVFNNLGDSDKVKFNNAFD